MSGGASTTISVSAGAHSTSALPLPALRVTCGYHGPDAVWAGRKSPITKSTPPAWADAPTEPCTHVGDAAVCPHTFRLCSLPAAERTPTAPHDPPPAVNV